MMSISNLRINTFKASFTHSKDYEKNTHSIWFQRLRLDPILVLLSNFLVVQFHKKKVLVVLFHKNNKLLLIIVFYKPH